MFHDVYQAVCSERRSRARHSHSHPPTGKGGGGVGKMGTGEGVGSHCWWITKITSRINPVRVKRIDR